MFRIESDSKGANTARTVRFTEKLFEQLNQIAVDNNVSFNSLVIQCCQYALDNYENTSSNTNISLLK